MRNINRGSKSYYSWLRSDAFSSSHDWAKARREAKERAGHQCEFPGCKRAIDHVHHRKPRNKYPELALEPDNLMCLCAPHHREMHGWARMPAHWLNYEPANDAQFELPLIDRNLKSSR